MTPFTPTHVHKVTGEQFEYSYAVSGGDAAVYDQHGFRRTCKHDMLAPIQPIEEWEPVPGYQVTADNKTGQIIAVCGVKMKWEKYPNPDLRLVDGCRLERRKV